MTTNYTRGAACERALIAKFEGMGYTCLRSAGSHTQVDVIRWNTLGIWFCQVKRGYLPPKEIEEILQCLSEMSRPPKSAVELWQWRLVKRRGIWWRYWLQDGIMKFAEAP